MIWLKSNYDNFTKLMDNKLRTKAKARKFFGIMGTTLALLHFWSLDLFSAVNFASYDTIAQSSASIFGGLKLYFWGMLLMSAYAVIGAFASILGTELFIMFCEAIKWKPKMYKLLTKDCEPCEGLNK